jgi:hypothetical protein
LTMDESLIKQYRVNDDAFRSVKFFYVGKTMIVPHE